MGPNYSAFEPTAKPGARIPHSWLPNDQSILDLVNTYNFPIFTLGELDLRGSNYVVVGSKLMLCK